MKLKNIILTVLAGAAALLTSCMPEETLINSLNGIELESSYITIAKGSYSASTAMTIDQSWTSTVPEWLSLTPSSGSAGNYTLTFTALADTLSQGEATINFGGKSQIIVVIRDGEKAKKPGVIFEEPFIGHGQGDFDIKNIVGSPWSYDAKYGMKATAYINNANTDAEALLISPEIDLTGETVAMLTFEDAVNYMDGNPVEDYLSVDVTTDNGGSWETVTVPTWPAGSGWDFVRSGDVDLSAYLGKKIKFAFHYRSNVKASPTWEVKNVKLSNVAGAVPPVVTVDPKSVTIDAEEGSSATVTATASGGTLEYAGPYSDEACTTEDSPAWITVSTEGGDVYTFTAAGNEGDARVCYVRFFSTNENGTTEEVVTVTQAANPGAKGAAITNPYTVAEAIEICDGKTYTSSPVYVKGIISQIDDISLSYGNAQYWISDDGTTDAQLEAYRSYWFNGEKFTSQDQLKVGDEVILCGVLTLYEKEGKDPVREFKQGNYLASLNGAVAYYTVAQAIEALNDGTAPVDDKVFVHGIISQIDEVSLSYGNAQYWLSDDGASADFEVFRGLWLEGQKFTAEDQIHVGDEVTVIGQITIYKKEGKPDVYEFKQNNYIYTIVSGSTPSLSVSEPDVTIAADATSAEFSVSAANLADGWKVAADGDYAWVTDYTREGTGSGKIAVAVTANTGAARTAKFTVSAAGVDDVVISLTQEMASGEEAYSVDFTQGQGDWAINNAEKPAEMESVWYWNASHPEYGAIASGYYSGSRYVTDALLISPEIKVPANGGYVTYEAAANYFYGKVGSLVSVLVREASSAGAASYRVGLMSRNASAAEGWNMLTDAVFTEDKYNFHKNSASLAAYAGKTVQIAIRYTSDGTSEGTGTLEVKSLSVSEASGPEEPGEPDVPVTVIDATVSEVIAAKDETATYRLSGEVSSFNSKYCSFNLTDATGTIYVYSVSNKDEWSDKVSNGGTVTLTGKYQAYTNKSGVTTDEIIDAVIESFVPAEGGEPGGETGEVKTVTIAQFLEAEESHTQKYQLTGTIGGSINVTYGDFDLTDETATVYVYGLTATELGYRASNDKSFGSLGLAEGDEITLIGYRSSYNGTIQVAYAYFVSKNSSGNIEDPEGVSTFKPSDASDGNSDRGTHTVVIDGVTMTLSDGLINDSEYRIYAGSTVTFKSDKPINKIVLNATANGQANYGPGNVTASTGSYKFKDKTGVWTGNSNTVILSAGKQVRATKIRVATGDAEISGGEGEGWSEGGAVDYGPVEGSGTVSSPYNVAGVLTFVSNFESNERSDGNVFIKGIVSRVQREFDRYEGTATYFISDDGTNKNEFEIYNGKYLEDSWWVPDDNQIAVGDAVIICGQVTNYNGTTPETVSKASYLYSLNGETARPSQGDVLQDPLTVTIAEFNAAANSAYQPYRITGIISNLDSYSGACTLTDNTGTVYVDGITAIVRMYGGRNRYDFSTITPAKQDGDVITVIGYRCDDGMCYAFYDASGPSTLPGNGTLANPYSPQEAKDLAAALDKGAKTDSDVYVKGKISSITYTFSAQYGTATFKISEDGTTSGTEFQCYGVKYLGNRAWVEGDTQIALGDDVIIYGKLMNYNGTPETANKEAYIYSLNGNTDYLSVSPQSINVAATETSTSFNIVCGGNWTLESDNPAFKPGDFSGSGDATVNVFFEANSSTVDSKVANITVTCGSLSKTVVITQSPASSGGGNDGSAAMPYTASEAASHASEGTSGVYVKGIVSSIATAYSASYGNVSLWISDDGTLDQFELFRAPATSATQYEVGDAVVFTGTLAVYNTTCELKQGNSMVAHVKAPAFSPASTSFTTSTSVTLSASYEGNATAPTIYYTTDGSTPTTSSTQYTSAINLTATTTVNAIAVCTTDDGVTLTTGVASKTYTMSEGGDEPGTSSGDGTLANPYSPQEASDVASALAAGAKTDGDVYVKGKISSITYTFSAQSGTARFKISEDGTTGGTEFLCFGVYYLGNRAWVVGDTQIEVGDDVIICGKLMNYSGTPETSNKEAYIYSLNGNTDYLSVSPSSINVAATETSTSFNIVCGGSWTLESDSPAFKPGDFSGSGDATVNVFFEANDGTVAKVATITVTSGSLSKTVVITQSPASSGGGGGTTSVDDVLNLAFTGVSGTAYTE